MCCVSTCSINGDNAMSAAFARSLGLEVTVEGIEDQATLDTVRELGCTFGQGYLLGRPMPAEDAQLLLTASVGAAMAAE